MAMNLVMKFVQRIFAYLANYRRIDSAKLVRKQTSNFSGKLLSTD